MIVANIEMTFGGKRFFFHPIDRNVGTVKRETRNTTLRRSLVG